MKRWSKVLALALIASGLSAPAAHGLDVTPVELGPGTVVNGLSDVTAMAVSATFVFLAEGYDGSKVAVMDTSGVRVGTISNIPAPVGLAVEGSTLFVAARDASAIYEYDVGSLPATQTGTFSTLPVASPTSLALSSGRLWYTGLDDENGPHGSIGSMTTTGTDVQPFYPEGYEYWQYYGTCGDMSWSPSADDRIFLHGAGCGSPDALYLYDTTTAPPVKLSNYGISNWGSYTSQPVTVLPDGTGMVVQKYSNLVVQSLDGLEGPVFSYKPTAGADVDGRALDAGISDVIASAGSTGDKDGVLVWEVGTVAPSNAFTFASIDGGVARKGLRFSTDGSTLFVVTIKGSRVAFHVIDPTAVGTSLSLSSSGKSISFGERITLEATLAGASGGGQSITLNRVVDGALKPIGKCETNHVGVCGWTLRPNASTTYEAVFDGGEGLAPSTSDRIWVNVAVVVSGRLSGGYGTSDGYRLYHRSQNVYYTATVDPARPGERVRVEFYFDLGPGGWEYSGSRGFDLDRYGRARIYFAEGSLPVGRYKLQSWYKGDDRFLGADSPWSFFRVTK